VPDRDGFRRLADDALRVTGVGGLGVAFAFRVGSVRTWLVYAPGQSTTLLAVFWLAAFALTFVAWNLGALVTHKYIGVPTHHPFHPPSAKPQEREALVESRLTPKLGIEYDEGIPPYFQYRRCYGEWAGRTVPYEERVFRVGVRNHSDITVRGVRLLLLDAKGLHQGHVGILPSSALRVKDSPASQESDVHRSDETTTFFDVAVHSLEPELHYVDDLNLCYAVGLIYPSLPTDPGTEVNLRLQLQGESVAPVTATFRLWVDAQNVAHLSRVSLETQEAPEVP
jgi:hypothetical protein